MSKFVKKWQKSSSKKSNFYNNIIIGGFFLVFTLALAGIIFSYLKQVNSIAPKAYEMQEIEKEIETLKEKNDRLKLEVAELKSMKNLEERIAALNLTKSNEIVFLKQKDVMMASK